MQGLQCQGENGENGTLVGKLMAGGLLTVPAGDNIVRMVPPLTIEATHVEEALSILDAAVGEMTTKAA